MRRVGNWLVAVTVVAVVALAVPAGADHTDQTDPNDTGGLLDLEAVGFDHSGAPSWRLVTFPAWSVRAIWDRGYLMVQLDTKGDAALDFLGSDDVGLRMGGPERSGLDHGHERE